MAVKPRIFAKAFPKLTIPLANQQCTLILVNQLKTNIAVQNPNKSKLETKGGGFGFSFLEKRKNIVGMHGS